MKPSYTLIASFVLVTPLIFLSCVNKTFPVTQVYQETQYRAENTTEKYTENLTTARTDSGEFELHSYFNWSNSGFFYYGYEIPDWSSYDNISLRLSLWRQMQYERVVLRVFDMSKTGQIQSPEPLLTEEAQPKSPSWYLITGTASPYWLESANTMISQARLLGATNYLWSQAADPQVIVLKAGRPSSIALVITGPQNRWNAKVTVDVMWTRSTVDQKQVTGERQVTRQVPFQVQKQRTVYEIRQVPFWETFLPH